MSETAATVCVHGIIDSYCTTCHPDVAHHHRWKGGNDAFYCVGCGETEQPRDPDDWAEQAADLAACRAQLSALERAASLWEQRALAAEAQLAAAQARLERYERQVPSGEPLAIAQVIGSLVHVEETIGIDFEDEIAAIRAARADGARSVIEFAQTHVDDVIERAILRESPQQFREWLAAAWQAAQTEG